MNKSPRFRQFTETLFRLERTSLKNKIGTVVVYVDDREVTFSTTARKGVELIRALYDDGLDFSFERIRHRDRKPRRTMLDEALEMGVGDPDLPTMIRKKRLSLGMTQAELADALHTKQQAVAAIETGKRPIGLDLARRLSVELEIPLGVIVQLSDSGRSLDVGRYGISAKNRQVNKKR